ncbi:MAG TPA: hypothetical protein VHL57_03825 [Flavobacteriales bacterium]|nr:hypothetical protein [Flavobacteriales bacterium]
MVIEHVVDILPESTTDSIPLELEPGDQLMLVFVNGMLREQKSRWINGEVKNRLYFYPEVWHGDVITVMYRMWERR